MAYSFTDDELRMLSVAAPVILRMLRGREVMIIQKIYGQFRNGQVDQTANIAELCSVRDQINEITSALKLNDN